MKCFYHASDFDGKCSAAIVKMVFNNCELYPVKYDDGTDPLSIVEKNEQVFIVDFSFKPFIMQRLNTIANLVWIDHHKTAIDKIDADLQYNIMGIREIGRAGCELTWEYFYSRDNMPEAVRLLGRYDVWDHVNVPGALEFQYGIRTIKDTDPNDLSFWSYLFNTPGYVEEIKDKGRIILEYESLQNEIYAKSCSFTKNIHGIPFIIINKGLCNSMIFNSVKDPSIHMAMMAFVYRHEQWCFSMYTEDPVVDVSAIASIYGGGGHRQAAGFSCSSIPKEFGF
jgi:uncharacterized protein